MSMTREEAIKYGENKLTLLRALGYNNYYTPGEYAGYYDEFSFVTAALSALRPITREQVEMVWKGCDLCLDDSWQRILMIPKRFDHTNMLSTELAQFCPGCGRPLTDKAVDMVMERLEALHSETKTD